MIHVLYNPETQVAKLAFTLPVTAGADVPVRIEFSPAPNAVSDIQLGFVSDEATPATLAFTDTIAPENASVWEGVLDANDTRLLAAIAGKTSLQVVLALVCIIDGHRLVNTTLRATVQPPVLNGPTATVGGPVFVLASVAGKYRFKTDGTFQLWNPDQSKFHSLTISGATGAEILSIGAGET